MMSCFRRKIESVSVDSPEEQKKNPRLQKFSITIFQKGEWPLLRAFCNKYSIKQIHLITVFQTYLSHEEVYVRKFRIRVNDPKVKFAPFSPLMQELADVFIPSIFLKEFKRLDLPDNPEECTFVRFIIMSYLFGCQPIPDLIYDFFAILRKNLTIHTTALIAVYSFQQVCLLLIEDLQNTGTYKFLKKAINQLDTMKDLRLSTCIGLGIKYPLLFYALIKFRKYFQRYIFGDQFWENRKHLKMKSLPHLPIDHDLYNPWFINEETARKYTARAFIMDTIYENKNCILFPTFYDDIIEKITYDEMVLLIERIGYKAARRLTVEGQIIYDKFDPTFLSSFKGIPLQRASSPPTKPASPPKPEAGVRSLLSSPTASAFGDLFHRSSSSLSELSNTLTNSLKPLSPTQGLLKSLSPSKGNHDTATVQPFSPTHMGNGVLEDIPEENIPTRINQIDEMNESQEKPEITNAGDNKAEGEEDDGVEDDQSSSYDSDEEYSDEEGNGNGTIPPYKRTASKKIHNLPDADHYTLIHDQPTDHEFVYDVATGRTNWVRVIRKGTGRIMRKLVTTNSK